MPQNRRIGQMAKVPGDYRMDIELGGGPMTRGGFLIKVGGGVVGGMALGGGLASTALGSPSSTAARSAASAAAAAPQTKMSFQIRWSHEVSFAGWYAAQHFDWFKKEGIDLNVIGGGPNLDVSQIIASGGQKFGEGYPEQLLAGRVEQNIPFVIFGALFQRSPSCFMSLKTSTNNWTRPKDLLGRRIATNAAGALVIKALLRNVGLPEENWTYVPAGFDPSPLIAGQVDFFHGFRTGQGVTLELDGHQVNYITYNQFNYLTYDGPFVVLQETLKQYPGLLARFLRASIKGWEWVNANPAAAAQMSVDLYGQSVGLDLKQQIAQGRSQIADIINPATKKYGLFWMTPLRWNNMISFNAKAGLISHTVPASQIMTQSVLKAALQGKSKLLTPRELRLKYTKT
jgi:ABC-type nitrate/sulfonate/bicarbonate transport system substrate-binding protein